MLADLAEIVRLMATRYPNLRIVYLSSRIYGGYATTTLNPEMYGPAFKPPIPPEAMVARNLKSPYPTNVSDGPAVRRRSVYRFLDEGYGGDAGVRQLPLKP